MAEGSIDRLSIEISGNADAAARSIRELASGLSALESSTGRGVSKLNELSRAVGALKSASSGVKLTSVANSVKKVSDAAAAMPHDAASKMKSVADAVRPLASIGSVKVGQLGKLPAIMREFASLDVSSLSSQMRQLNSSLAPLSASVERLARAYGSMPRSMRSAAVAARSVREANNNLRQATEHLAAANTKAGRTLGSWASSVSTMRVRLLAMGHALKSTLGSAINEVNTYIENMNLFEAAMGSYTQSASRFGNKVQEVMGIDFGEWARNQGVFMTLATGMGVTADKASVMSQQLTQLGYDISSFYNLDVQDAMLKLQSGLAGELEPLRRIGWDLSNARMNLELAKMGIEGNAQSMTQAEKVALRYKMIMEQVTITHGDMARTLASPANQIRVLRAQVTLAARAVGNLFIPALNAILPVAIGVVKAIRLIAQTIAGLFGIDATFEVDYSGLDTSGIATGNEAVEDTADALDDAGSAASDAARKVKEYQNTVMGFDELNKLNATPEYDDADGGGKGSYGGAGGAGLGGIDVPTYDFLDGVDKAITELSDKIARNIVEALKKVLPVVAGIGAAFATWKIANAILDNADKLDDALSRSSRSAARLSGNLAKAGNMRLAGITAGLSDKLSAARVQLGGIVKAPQQFLVASAPWAAAVGLVVGHFANLLANSENFRRGLETIRGWLDKLPDPAEALKGALDAISSVVGDVAKALGDWWSGIEVKLPWLADVRQAFEDAAGAVAGFLEEIGALDAIKAFGNWVQGTFDGIMDVFDLQWTDAAMAIGIVIALLSANPVVAGFLAAAEAVSLAIRAIGWATSPVVEEVDALAGVSEETAARFGTSLDSMGTAMETLDALDFANAVVTDEDKAAIEAAVTDIHDTIVNNLDAKRNEELASIEALAGVLTPEEVEEAKQKVNEYYDGLKGIIDNGQNEILGIISAANAEGRNLTEEESARIKQINDEQYKYLLETSGASADELNAIQENMAENQEAAALQAAEKVMQAAWDAKEQQEQAAEDTYNTTRTWAERMRENGDINEEEYQRIMAAAAEARDSTIADAQDQYASIENETRTKLGSVADEFDWQERRIKQNWQSWLEGMVSWWEWFADTIGQGVQVGGIVGSYSFSSSGSPYAVGRFASGGFPATGQLFYAREDGNPELVGRMGRRTAVANTGQIVEGIEAGVTNAMLQVLPAFSAGNDGDVTMVLMVDSEELARATARGQASAARRGQLSTSLAIA